MGVHDPSDLAAKDPMPPPPRPAAKSKEPLEPLRFRLATGLLHDLSVIIDQNERTMTIMERSFVSTRQVGETIKLAHVGKLATRRTAGGVELVAIRRDGTEFKLAQGKGAEFIATAARLAKGVRIPYAES
jgi:hypothetical protein